MEEQLRIALSQVIGEFSTRRAEIAQLAYQTGGQEAVRKVSEEYDALRDAYHEILKKQLDRNSHLYDKLVTAANTEIEKLRASVTTLNNINDIINLSTAIISLVGRILIVLGV